MNRNRSLEEIQEDIRTLTRVPSEFIHAKLNELAEEVGELTKSKWIPCSEKLPELKLVYESNFNNKYESEQVLVQTKRGEMFAAKCMKCTYTKDFKDEIEFYTYGTGGRRMKVKSKVIAWMPLPELYKGE